MKSAVVSTPEESEPVTKNDEKQELTKSSISTSEVKILVNEIFKQNYIHIYVLRYYSFLSLSGFKKYKDIGNYN